MDTSPLVMRRVLIIFVLVLLVSNIPIYFLKTQSESQSSVQRTISDHHVLDWSGYISEDYHITNDGIYVVVESSEGALLIKYDFSIKEVWNTLITDGLDEYSNRYQILHSDAQQVIVGWNNVTEYVVDGIFETFRMTRINAISGEIMEEMITRQPGSSDDIIGFNSRILSDPLRDMIVIPRLTVEGTLQGTVDLFVDLVLIRISSLGISEFRYELTTITDQDWFYFLRHARLLSNDLALIFSQIAGEDEFYIYSYTLKLGDLVDSGLATPSQLSFNATTTHSGQDIAVNTAGNVLGWQLDNSNTSSLAVYYRNYHARWEDPRARWIVDEASTLNGETFVFIGRRLQADTDGQNAEEGLFMLAGGSVGNDYDLTEVSLDGIVTTPGRVGLFQSQRDLVIFDILPQPTGAADAGLLIVMKIPQVSIFATLRNYTPWNIVAAMVGAIIAFVIMQKQGKREHTDELYPQ